LEGEGRRRSRRGGVNAAYAASPPPDPRLVARIDLPPAGGGDDHCPACALSAAMSASPRHDITATLPAREQGSTTCMLPSCSSSETSRTSLPRVGRSNAVQLLAEGS